jgi:aminoglycoside 2''-phosphotransferase
MDNDRLISRIKEIYPDLKIKKSERNNFGQNNDVLIINDLFVFRFPKYNEGIENLAREILLLNMLENKITVPIPSPLYTSLDVKLVGMAFAGYRSLEGSLCGKKT